MIMKNLPQSSDKGHLVLACHIFALMIISTVMRWKIKSAESSQLFATLAKIAKSVEPKIECSQ